MTSSKYTHIENHRYLECCLHVIMEVKYLEWFENSQLHVIKLDDPQNF